MAVSHVAPLQSDGSAVLDAMADRQQHHAGATGGAPWGVVFAGLALREH